MFIQLMMLLMDTRVLQNTLSMVVGHLIRVGPNSEYGPNTELFSFSKILRIPNTELFGFRI